jgi:hypothetical protein
MTAAVFHPVRIEVKAARTSAALMLLGVSEGDERRRCDALMHRTADSRREELGEKAR